MPLITKAKNPAANAVISIVVGVLVLGLILGALYAAARWAAPPTPADKSQSSEAR